MIFSLTNSPGKFHKMMNDFFKELINEGELIIYMDDILILAEPRNSISQSFYGSLISSRDIALTSRLKSAHSDG